eukprot:4352245-Pyramimonas_sp.AAC.1
MNCRRRSHQQSALAPVLRNMCVSFIAQGQTEATIELPPGKHQLLLQFANYKHESYGKALSKVITVNVQ